MLPKALHLNKVQHTHQLSIRCPTCRHLGQFSTTPLEDLNIVIYESPTANNTHYANVGFRICPNPACRQLVVFTYTAYNTTTFAFPPEMIDFDSSNLPTKIVSTFEEALSCHANQCYRASAMMLRRTLEELCNDKQAKGNDLKDRLTSLTNQVLLPTGLLQGVTELRLLGNDAAHIEAREYDQIGDDEIRIAADITKLILQSIYQTEDLVKRLQSLKAQNKTT